MKHVFQRNIPLAVAALVVAFVASCASVDKTIRKAEAALAIGEYAEAAAQFRIAYQRTPSKEREKRGELSFRMAEAYRRYGNVARAVGSYRSAVRYHFTDSITYLHQGDALRLMGDYKGAAAAYALYLEQNPGSPEAEAGMLSCAEAAKLLEEESAYTVRPATLFNSSRSDYCPALLGEEGDQLYFTSTRRQAKGGDLSGITAMKPGDIFFARKDEKGRWKQAEAAEGQLNSDLDEGACSFAPDGQKMYLTVCPVDATYPRAAEIWTAQRSDASWGKPQKLKITNDTLSSYAHPAVSPDGKYLYFTSDMPGGYGGLDLWRVQNDGHGMGAVENLGPSINTSGNEAFPAFRPSGELYFSSDGHAPALGGLDLYRAVEDTIGHTWTVKHLPVPMNSAGDDFGITFEGKHNRGFFSSSRSTGGRGWDKLYEFYHPEQMQTVKGWVYEQDGYELPAAEVYMIGSDGTNQKLSVLSDGSFEQPVEHDVDYLFLATCPGYLNVQQALRPENVEREVQHVLQFPLPSINIPVLVRGISYEFNKAVLTDSSRVALDRLVDLLKQNAGVVIELSSHCDYRGSDAYNLRLSQARADSVVSYLVRHGIPSQRLTAKGYGEEQPKVVTKRLAEAYNFLHVGDTLSEEKIKTLEPTQQEIAHAINRRTEFRVLRNDFGLFDADGNIRPEAIKPKPEEPADEEARPAEEEEYFED